MKIKYQFLSITIALFLSSCAKNFDSDKWKDRPADWQLLDVREKMVENLIDSDTLIRLDTLQIFELLGSPEFKTEHDLRFLIREKYGLNVDPICISYLVIDLDDYGKAKKISIEKLN